MHFCPQFVPRIEKIANFVPSSNNLFATTPAAGGTDARDKFSNNMARPKKQVKAKEPVTIRLKPCRNGNQSIYLDIYRDGQRNKEYLKLYLIPERPNHPEDKITNQTTMQAANAIKAERMRKLINGEAGIKETKCKILLLDWMQLRRENAERIARDAGRRRCNNGESIFSVTNHLAAFIEKHYNGRPITLADVDKDFCIGFAEYLKTAGQRKGKSLLSTNARSLYYSKLTAALNAAVKAGHIQANPVNLLDRTEKPHQIQTERDYLTENELQALINTPCTHTDKDAGPAFLFSCFCGLRWSDISVLTWGDVRTDAGTYWIEKRMVKTQELITLPLSADAVFFMPERGNKKPTDPVFNLGTYDAANRAVKKWVKDAGIDKAITFHCARHTFATLMLTNNVDIYTTSKLLGHKSIKVTQIYAAVVDKKKREAVNAISGKFNLSK